MGDRVGTTVTRQLTVDNPPLSNCLFFRHIQYIPILSTSDVGSIIKLKDLGAVGGNGREDQGWRGLSTVEVSVKSSKLGELHRKHR